MDVKENGSFFNVTAAGGRMEFTPTEAAILRITQGIIAILVIFSIFTNAVVIRIFLSRKFGKITGAKVLYASISLSDELFLLTCVLQATIYGNECNGNCRIVLSYGTHISGFVSTYTMAFIAFKRYQAIAFPIQNRSTMSVSWATYGGICFIWCFSIVISLLFVRYVDVKQFNSSFFARICTIISSPVLASYKTPYFSLIAMVSVPLLFGLLFSLKSVHLLLTTKIVGESLGKDQVDLKKRQKLRSTSMIMIVIVTFAVCWLPITIFYTFERLNYQTRLFCDYNFIAYSTFSALLMVEFGANPVIYWFMNPDFRKGLLSFCQICKCEKRANF